MSSSEISQSASSAQTRPKGLDKSAITHGAGLIFIGLGFLLPEPFNRPVLYVGLFAFSGAVTNWLAIHMLFEKVPGLYGSGVIPARFEDIKLEIHRLVMEQFFSAERIERFLSPSSDGDEDGEGAKFNFDPIIDDTDLSPIFDAFIAVVEGSPLGGMLGMFGGRAALEPLREPFIDKMKLSIKDLAATPSFQNAVQAQISGSSTQDALKARVEVLIQERLDELTPQQVKEIMQNMIRDHLGWLVVWGGVFGGLMGLITSLLPFV